MYCSTCNQDKTEIDFSLKGVKRQSMCKECNKAYQREHYKANKQRYKDKSRAYEKEYKLEIRNWLWDYLESRGCIDCGLTNPMVLDFDHRYQEDKLFGIANAVKGGYSSDKIKTEVAKCDVRCANCHRICTAEQLGWYAWRKVPVI